MKIKIAILTMALTAVTAFGQSLTPFAYQGYNSDGSPQTNPVTFQAFPPINGIVVVGTNIYSGGINPSFTPNASGFFSNTITPNSYRVSIPAQSLVFYVNIPATATYQSLSTYITNQPVIPGQTTSYGIVTNMLGFGPATNNPTFNTGSNPTNSFTVGVVYANGNYRSLLTGYASADSINFTNNLVSYSLPLTNECFTIPLGSNATFSFIGPAGSITNAQLWY